MRSSHLLLSMFDDDNQMGSCHVGEEGQGFAAMARWPYGNKPRLAGCPLRLKARMRLIPLLASLLV